MNCWSAATRNPTPWHDFGGFPQALFEMQYPAPGDPLMAAEVADRLEHAGLHARIDPKRPFDHGVWVPLSLMYPQADIPIVQVSLPTHGGPALQTRVGQALAGLRELGVLLIRVRQHYPQLARTGLARRPGKRRTLGQGISRLDGRETRGAG